MSHGISLNNVVVSYNSGSSAVAGDKYTVYENTYNNVFFITKMKLDILNILMNTVIITYIELI